MFCAHIHEKSKKEQSVLDHLQNVSLLAEEYSSKISMETTGKLIGILHDLGKETDIFNKYIRFSAKNPNDYSLRGKINHSTAGAKYIYDLFFETKDPYQMMAVQLISQAICSHHGGLIDSIDLKGTDVFSGKMTNEKDICYEEAVSNFTEECLSKDQINELFIKALIEVKVIYSKINALFENDEKRLMAMGFVEKFLFSCVIDADRYDTYSFMADVELKKTTNQNQLWQDFSAILEAKLSSYPTESKMDFLRHEISLECKMFAKENTGIYQLFVPTGGGKTLSSLRFGVEHAKEHGKERIFYVIPFTTIIDQNAKEIKNILEREDVILEHHSNLIVDNDFEEYKLLTERWDSPIIMTTMVQFLNTLFNGGTQDVRRLHNLANAVIIFDEIQSIPIKCIHLFNCAMNFLSKICNATIVLCSATQPLLSTTRLPIKLSNNCDIITNMETKFSMFKRVHIHDQRIRGGYSALALSQFILDKMNSIRSLLVIVNTKKNAKDIYQVLEELNKNLEEEQKITMVHLSTNMCPNHRLSVLENMKKKLGHNRVICVSTQLIEAGVNISFECVIRSLAGLDSIAQASGRCNRHGEKDFGDVFIVNLEDENVDKLIDIKEGQLATERLLHEFNTAPDTYNCDLLSPKAMNQYYQYYFHERRMEMEYRLRKPNDDQTLVGLLTTNITGKREYKNKHNSESKLILKHAFKTAGNNFQVIDQNTTTVLVPYEEGEKLIIKLNGNCSLYEMKDVLKKAQQYSVNLYELDFRRLNDLHALDNLNNVGIIALKKEFYDVKVGVVTESKGMEFYDF